MTTNHTTERFNPCETEACKARCDRFGVACEDIAIDEVERLRAEVAELRDEREALRGCLHQVNTAAVMLHTFEIHHEGNEEAAAQNIVDAIVAAVAEREAMAKQEHECEVCEGKGTIDERLGGEWNSDPKATCPNCDGRGWWLESRPQTASPVPIPEGWQPIETAPTDWGSYLVWHPKHGMETLFFQLKDGGRDGRTAGNWYSEDDDEDDTPKNWRVTHWMPLPAAPKHPTSTEGGAGNA